MVDASKVDRSSESSWNEPQPPPVDVCPDGQSKLVSELTVVLAGAVVTEPSSSQSMFTGKSAVRSAGMVVMVSRRLIAVPFW